MSDIPGRLPGREVRNVGKRLDRLGKAGKDQETDENVAKLAKRAEVAFRPRPPWPPSPPPPPPGRYAQERAAHLPPLPRWRDPLFDSSSRGPATWHTINEMRERALLEAREGTARELPNFSLLRTLYEDDPVVLTLIDLLEDAIT